MITIDSLSKKYGASTVVDDVSFVAPAGRVTGFLGPNGAGKSTSMRMMVGLTSPTSGSATISGRRFADLPNPGREVGVMLDASAQHAGRTGREILTIAQRMMGLPGRPVPRRSSWSASPKPRRTVGWANTRSGCASDSAYIAASTAWPVLLPDGTDVRGHPARWRYETDVVDDGAGAVPLGQRVDGDHGRAPPRVHTRSWWFIALLLGVVDCVRQREERGGISTSSRGRARVRPPDELGVLVR